MSALTGRFNAGDHSVTDAARNRRFGPVYSRNVRAVVARGLMATKSSNWMVMVSGFFEPVLYLSRPRSHSPVMPAGPPTSWSRRRTRRSSGPDVNYVGPPERDLPA